MLTFSLSARRGWFLLRLAGRGLPGGNSLFFASPKKSKQKKGDPGVCVPFASLRGSLWCSVQTGSKTTRFAQTSFCPDPSGPALLGAYTRGGDKNTNTNTKQPNTNGYLKKQGLAMASPCWYFSPLPIPIAPSWLGRGAQRQADKGSRCLSAVKRSEFSETPLGSSTVGCPGAKRRGPRLRVAFLLVTFLWRSKEKLLAAGQPPASHPPQGIRWSSQSRARGQQDSPC